MVLEQEFRQFLEEKRVLQGWNEQAVDNLWDVFSVSNVEDVEQAVFTYTHYQDTDDLLVDYHEWYDSVRQPTTMSDITQKTTDEVREVLTTTSTEDVEDEVDGMGDYAEGDRTSPTNFEDLNLPSKVKERLISEYENASEEEKETALKQAQAITMVMVRLDGPGKEKWNTVEIAGKTFSFLMPEADGRDVFAGEKGEKNGKKYDYTDVRYIKGEAMQYHLGDKQMFADGDAFEAFVEKHIPGTTRKARLQNFADIMGMELSGYRFIDEEFYGLGDHGSVWVSRSVDGVAYHLTRTPGDADASRIGDDHYARPVLCFQSKG